MLLILFIVQVVTLAGLACCFFLLRRNLQAASEADLERLVATGVEDLLQELQDSADKAIRDLARQKATLQKLLREADKRIQLMPEDDPAPAPAARGKGKRKPPPARRPSWEEQAIQLANDGMHANAIARQLHAGVEEVRLVLSRAFPPSA